ncbi:hypothetical protein FRC11_011231 [Ceratobasidium sp. 423]|nr:hypothetical protein FRC11_011231 [Ceratobasidium sp. 423]
MFMSGERFGSLYAKSRMLIELNPKNPTKCSAVKLNANKVWKAASDAVTVFDRNGSKSKGTTAANIKSFEENLFATEGWISPLKLVEILFAAGTVMRYKESDKATPKSVLAKFNYFAEETNGQALLARELKTLAELEGKEPSGQAVVSIPQRLLLLARQDGASGDESGSGE